ncbi:unnamed protein product [Strongylus vulgaris]|uniref:Uncharacterized protein n=1 Tax=Strongylus vulgaris TaxID=40348 RepID=A0A3P7LM53_STRVU|nr:unnamed protein product [Strongylus vulgaris]
MAMSAPCFAYFGEEAPISQILYAIINFYMALSLAIVVWLSLAALGELQRLSNQLLRYFNCKRRIANDGLIPTAAARDPKSTTEKYFSQLQSIWA